MDSQLYSSWWCQNWHHLLQIRGGKSKNNVWNHRFVSQKKDMGSLIFLFKIRSPELQVMQILRLWHFPPIIMVQSKMAVSPIWVSFLFWVHPGRLTWNIIIEVWKIIFLSKWVICMFHVNLPGCSFPFPWSMGETLRRMGVDFFPTPHGPFWFDLIRPPKIKSETLGCFLFKPISLGWWCCVCEWNTIFMYVCVYIYILCIYMFKYIYIYTYIYFMPLMVKTRWNLFRVKIHKVKMIFVTDDDVYADFIRHMH